eukprot:6802316-Alexandrium_andersonii.AAC.1
MCAQATHVALPSGPEAWASGEGRAQAPSPVRDAGAMRVRWPKRCSDARWRVALGRPVAMQ